MLRAKLKMIPLTFLFMDLQDLQIVGMQLESLLIIVLLLLIFLGMGKVSLIILK